MRALLASTLLLLSCAATRRGPECDKGKLLAPSEQLAPLPTRGGVEVVWAGVADACGDELPGASRFTSGGPEILAENGPLGGASPGSDKRLQEMIASACPDSEARIAAQVAERPNYQRGRAAYEGCNFSRYGLLAGSEVFAREPGLPTW